MGKYDNDTLISAAKALAGYYIVNFLWCEIGNDNFPVKFIGETEIEVFDPLMWCTPEFKDLIRDEGSEGYDHYLDLADLYRFYGECHKEKLLWLFKSSIRTLEEWVPEALAAFDTFFDQILSPEEAMADVERYRKDRLAV